MTTTNATNRCFRRLIAAGVFAACSLNPLVALAASEEPVPETDSPPVELLVSVRFGKDMASRHGAASGSVQYNRDDRQGQDQPPRQVRVYQTPSRTITRQVRVLENHTAYISHNESVPSPAAFSDAGSPRGYPYYALQYRDLQSGFTVRPRFSKEQLLLDISASSDSQSQRGGGIIDSTRIQTTIAAELGQWIRLGGIDDQIENIAGTYRTPPPKTRDEEQVWVRVERLN